VLRRTLRMSGEKHPVRPEPVEGFLRTELA